MQTLTVSSVLLFGLFVFADVQHKTARFLRTRLATPRHDLQSRQFSVKFDHFSPQDSRFVNFTYTQNVDYYRSNGPIFIYINDAGELTTELLEIGLMHDIAIDAGAALITANNRFFRSNLATENASLENLQLLTIEQTINDIGRLIQVVKDDLNAPNGRVVLWGSGLGATLATWTKQKYPNLVDGVWSSSGVYEHIVHSNEPYEQLTRTLASVGGQQCADNMLAAFETMESMMFTYQYIEMADRLGMCYFPIFWIDEDAAAFFAGITQLIIDYINVYHHQGAANLCADLNVTDVSHFDALAGWVRYVYTEENCLDVSFFTHSFQSSLTDWDEVTELNWGETDNLVYPFLSRSLFYLRCSQLGLFPTSVNARSSFGNVVGQDMYFIGCTQAFGEGYDYLLLARAVEQLQLHYGGKNPAIPNVLYTNGELDTFFSFGITKEPEGIDTFVRNIPGYARSADIWSLSVDDTEELAKVKNEIRQLVLKWSGIA